MTGVHAGKDPTLIDELSTKEIGIIKWQYFFDKAVAATEAENPVFFSSYKHLCWFQWRLEQPFAGVDERYSIAVTHNCPEAVISHIEFDLSFDDTGDAHVVVDQDTPDGDVNSDSITNIVVKAKTEAGDGDDQDFGIWHPADGGEPGFRYAYRIVRAGAGEPTPERFVDMMTGQ